MCVCTREHAVPTIQSAAARHRDLAVRPHTSCAFGKTDTAIFPAAAGSSGLCRHLWLTWSNSRKQEKRGWWMTMMTFMPRLAMSLNELRSTQGQAKRVNGGGGATRGP